MIKIYCTSFLFLLFFAFSHQSAYAKEKEPETIVLQPTFQEVTLEEASISAQAIITVKNQTKVDQQFSIFAVDISQMDADGNVILSDKPVAGNDYALANFLTIEPSSIVLKSEQSNDISITISNLQDLSPGGHYAAIVVKGVPFTQAEDRQTILPALSSFLLVRKKGGERYHLSLKSVTEGSHLIWWKLPTNLELLFENQGNVQTAPRGEVKVIDMFHRKVVEGTINEGSKIVLPQSQRKLETNLRKILWAWPVMAYNVHIGGRSDPGGIGFEQSFTIFVVSPTVMSILFFIVITIGVLLIFRKRVKQLIKKTLRRK